MSLVDDLAQPSNGGCGLAQALDQLNDSDRALAEAAIDNPQWGPVQLAERFAKNQVAITNKHITRHRRGECQQCL